MKKSNFNKPIMCGILSFIAVFAFAKPDKVIQIFRNGEVIQEYDVSDIDYIEVNDRTPVPDNPDKPDKPDNPDNPKEPDNGVITGTAEPHAFRALLHGQYSGNKLPESVGFEYSYDSSFPKNKTAAITT